MAGLDDVQWQIVQGGLAKIDDLTKAQSDSELRLTKRLGDIELSLSERIRGIETGLFKGNGTKSLEKRVDDLECQPDKRKNWIANVISLVIAVVAVGIAWFKP